VAHKLSWFSTDHVGVLLPKIKKNPKNTNGRLAIPAPAGLLVFPATTLTFSHSSFLFLTFVFSPWDFYSLGHKLK